MNNQLTTKDIGSLGESIAREYLVNRGYKALSANYWKNGTEIDLIVSKDGIVHFVEVKTVSHETRADLLSSVSHETWLPEEQVHQFKLHQIARAIEGWIAEHAYQGEWVIDVAAVRVVPRETYATVKFLENITF